MLVGQLVDLAEPAVCGWGVMGIGVCSGPEVARRASGCSYGSAWAGCRRGWCALAVVAATSPASMPGGRCRGPAQKSSTGRPRTPPTSKSRCASPASSGGYVAATRSVRVLDSTWSCSSVRAAVPDAAVHEQSVHEACPRPAGRRRRHRGDRRRRRHALSLTAMRTASPAGEGSDVSGLCDRCGFRPLREGVSVRVWRTEMPTGRGRAWSHPRGRRRTPGHRDERERPVRRADAAPGRVHETRTGRLVLAAGDARDAVPGRRGWTGPRAGSGCRVDASSRRGCRAAGEGLARCGRCGRALRSVCVNAGQCAVLVSPSCSMPRSARALWMPWSRTWSASCGSARARESWSVPAIMA